MPGDDVVEAKLESLRPKEPGRRYPHFVGSLGAKPGCVFVIGERPSFCERYGDYMKRVDPRLSRLRSLPELGEFLQQPPEFHMTDYIKFRGGRLMDKLSDEMIDISRHCLLAEFDLLKPKMVLLTCMAGEGMLQFLGLPELRRHLQYSKFVAVPHWARQFNEEEWVSRVRDAIRPR